MWDNNVESLLNHNGIKIKQITKIKNVSTTSTKYVYVFVHRFSDTHPFSFSQKCLHTSILNKKKSHVILNGEQLREMYIKSRINNDNSTNYGWNDTMVNSNSNNSKTNINDTDR